MSERGPNEQPKQLKTTHAKNASKPLGDTLRVSRDESKDDMRNVSPLRNLPINRATGPGPKAVRSATRFERDVEHAQKELDMDSTNDPSNVYIGEWHSHLVATPVPSGRDVLSLTGIAQSSNYATDCPIMLICGFDKEKSSIGELKGWAFPVESSMRMVGILYISDSIQKDKPATPPKK